MKPHAPLVTTLCFTDIHFGAKLNSEAHNQDCLDFIEWVVGVVAERAHTDAPIDSVVFLGDWFEHRSAINVSTMTYAMQGAKLLSSVGVPVFMIVGNHDLYHKHTREIYSPLMYETLPNFTVVNTPTVVSEMGDGCLVCPYLFHEEYDTLAQYAEVPVWFGHFEFQGFVVTGYSNTLKDGPKHGTFKDQRRIFSGHFHKRQRVGNVTYIGNTFPTSFADANDVDRGLMIYDHMRNKTNFMSWPDAPSYSVISIEEAVTYTPASDKDVVECRYDPATAPPPSELQQIRDRLSATTGVREIRLSARSSEMPTSVEELNLDVDIHNLDAAIVSLLSTVDVPGIDTELLVAMYTESANG